MKRRIFIIIVLVAVLVAVLIPIPSPEKKGAYNTISGLIWCTSELSCIHEVAHKLDDEAGWISHENEFSLAVAAFVWHEIANYDPPHPFVYRIMRFPGVFLNTPSVFTDDNAELYASIFEWSEGKKESMPEIFHRFYDFDRAQELMKRYER